MVVFYLDLASEGSSRDADNTISVVASSTGIREGPLELSHGDGTIALAGDMAHVCGGGRSSTGRNRCGSATFRDLDNVIVATAAGGSLVRRALVMFMMGSDS